MIELIVIGIIVGGFAGFLGMGGGILTVPTLLYLGYDIKTAIGVSIAQMLFSSILNIYLNNKSGFIIKEKMKYIILGGITGAFLSAFLVLIISKKIALLLFLGFLIMAYYKFIMLIKQKFSKKHVVKKVINEKLLFPITTFLSTVSFTAGVGGAMVLIPTLINHFGLDSKKAIGSASIFIFVSSFIAFFTNLFLGSFNLSIAIPVAVGSLFGVYLGQRLMKITPHKIVEISLFIVLNIILGATIFKLY